MVVRIRSQAEFGQLSLYHPFPQKWNLAPTFKSPSTVLFRKSAAASRFGQTKRLRAGKYCSCRLQLPREQGRFVTGSGIGMHCGVSHSRCEGSLDGNAKEFEIQKSRVQTASQTCRFLSVLDWICARGPLLLQQAAPVGAERKPGQNRRRTILKLSASDSEPNPLFFFFFLFPCRKDEKVGIKPPIEDRHHNNNQQLKTSVVTCSRRYDQLQLAASFSAKVVKVSFSPESRGFAPGPGLAAAAPACTPTQMQSRVCGEISKSQAEIPAPANSSNPPTPS